MGVLWACTDAGNLISLGIAEMRFVPTAFNLADLLTKAVSKHALEELLPALLGQREPTVPEPEKPHH